MRRMHIFDSARARTAVGVFMTVLLAVACGEQNTYLGGDRPVEPPPPFTSEDGSVTSVPDGGQEPLSYCPSNKCPLDRTTCPDSKFLCDVDVMSDVNNCGGCGLACPTSTGSETFSCINGQCVMNCSAMYGDCDLVVDNGCETVLTTNDHCGACGTQCDPETAGCNRDLSEIPTCGCADPFSYCPADNPYAPVCFNLQKDDNSCGTCGNGCDSWGPPGAPSPPPNSYYGCNDGECGHLKCFPEFSDCNDDLAEPDSDGCETQLGTHDACTACGDDCTAKGQFCVDQSPVRKPKSCGCAAGENFCGSDFGSSLYGACTNVTSDPANCGACGRVCPGNSTRSKAVCDYGECKLECLGRWADCNGDFTDNCETDTFGDPENCGGCGIRCDIEAGQACSSGRCVVEPCTDGEETR